MWGLAESSWLRLLWIRYGYRKELLGLLQQLVRDMDRKIERQRDRAAKESENRIPTPQEQSQLDELKVTGRTSDAQWGLAMILSHSKVPSKMQNMLCNRGTPPSYYEILVICSSPSLLYSIDLKICREEQILRPAGCHICSKQTIDSLLAMLFNACLVNNHSKHLFPNSFISGIWWLVAILLISDIGLKICICFQNQEKEVLRQSEETAEQGNVDASMTFAQQAEAFKKQHDELLKTFTTPERTMSVCDVCGVFINSTDNDQRKAVSAWPNLLCFMPIMSWKCCLGITYNVLVEDKSFRGPQRRRSACSKILAHNLLYLKNNPCNWCQNALPGSDWPAFKAYRHAALPCLEAAFLCWPQMPWSAYKGYTCWPFWQDHLAGKQYLGWEAIRNKLKEFEKDEEERKASRPDHRSKEAEAHRPRDRERDRPRERDLDGRCLLYVYHLLPAGHLLENLRLLCTGWYSDGAPRHCCLSLGSFEARQSHMSCLVTCDVMLACRKRSRSRDRHRSSRSDRDRSDRHRSERDRDRLLSNILLLDSQALPYPPFRKTVISVVQLIATDHNLIRSAWDSLYSQILLSYCCNSPLENIRSMPAPAGDLDHLQFILKNLA